MRKRVLITAIGFFGIALLLSAFAYHKITFDYRYRTHRSLWIRASDGNYDATVISNSLDYPSGGTNELNVRDGRLVNGFNSNCDNCTNSDFQDLLIESLFDRIFAECIDQTIVPICNVEYDETLGYPTRLDTYTFYEGGVHAPSITIPQVQIIE